jgi:hypothetical protein
MKKIIFISILSVLLFSKDDFISEYEYGEMLYNNPRGISCVSCHGEFGEGKVIAKAKDDEGKEQIFKGNDIRQLSLKDFHKALNSNHEIMPRYYLVNKEVIAIYKFVKEKNRRLTKPKVHIEEEELFIYNGDLSDEEI